MIATNTTYLPLFFHYYVGFNLTCLAPSQAVALPEQLAAKLTMKSALVRRSSRR
jgi:hypothetical protein